MFRKSAHSLLQTLLAPADTKSAVSTQQWTCLRQGGFCCLATSGWQSQAKSLGLRNNVPGLKMRFCCTAENLFLEQGAVGKENEGVSS